MGKEEEESGSVTFEALRRHQEQGTERKAHLDFEKHVRRFFERERGG